MSTNANNLSKEELELLLAELELTGIDSTDASTRLSTADQSALQNDLKMRLEKPVAELQSRNEPVPQGVINLLERL